MNIALHDRLATAKKLARDAGALALSYQERLRRNDLVIIEKGVQDFVSEADQTTERLIRDELARQHPEDGFLGEETGSCLHGQGVWVVDPIDGTNNYLRQHRHWCVSIAYVVDGEPLLGVIYDPSNDELFSALIGQGAYLNDCRLHADHGNADRVRIVNLGYSAKTELQHYLRTIERLFEQGIDHRRHGSAALGLAHVAAGRFDGYMEAFINAWDIMAGVIIVREAGLWVELQTRPGGYAIRAGVPALAPILV
ncbi:inositol monophosphatase family protein [Polaromonas jejuensis]|uniref:Inositol-1-monophosphatase n=1 Tax=Polaromonas jejuensis TaxID=457502 RepID=A0ABW0QD90_9BURK|nr:inositol monophosphatase family protein [Polaromonas jejuensis]